MNVLVYDLDVDIDQGIHKEKMKVARNEKRKKLHGFCYYKNIANFEEFVWNLNLSTIRLFWRCVALHPFGNCSAQFEEKN